MTLTTTPPAFPSLDALRAGDGPELDRLAARVREFLVEHVTAHGGHLGPNLGVVELTIALHRVFDSPRDTLLFDTGHQAYVHKVLTGRYADFTRLREYGGLSGYPSRAESVHDHVENSHASTALSYADGLAKARALSGADDRHVVAVVGDGALTGGVSLEALNAIGAAPDRPVVIVLNDNGLSYAPTVGALAQHLSGLRHAPGAADGGPPAAPGTPATARRSLFEHLGLRYLGPVDGHDRAALEEALTRARALGRPVVVHVVTVKGKGHGPAEADEEDRLHTVSAAPRRTARSTRKPEPGPAAPGSGSARGGGTAAGDGQAPSPSWTEVFAAELVRLAAERGDLVAVTAAMPGPTGLSRLAAVSPERVFDVGIAEQHAVLSAAGLAMGGCHPVVALYATFLGRAFDQVLMDVALHRLPVTFALDRAGVTGPDGPSHHGMWDLSVLSLVPGLRVAVPRDGATLRALLREAVEHGDGPTAVRFPKGRAGPDLPAAPGGAGTRPDGPDVLVGPPVRDVLLVAVGPMAAPCLAAAEELTAQGVQTAVVDPRWVLPVPAELVRRAAAHRLVVTVEDNLRTQGAGSSLAQTCRAAGVRTPVVNLGLPHAFGRHGPRDRLLKAAGLDARGIVAAVLRARAGHPLHTAPGPEWSA